VYIEKRKIFCCVLFCSAEYIMTQSRVIQTRNVEHTASNKRYDNLTGIQLD